MARIEAGRRELAATIVVYGPPKAGKTAILHCVQDRVAPARRSQLLPPSRDQVPPPLLDWLPLELGVISGWRVRVNLYAIPDQRHADATRRLILADADGVMFAADSQASRIADNLVALQSLQENLNDPDGHPREVPLVFVYTKHDLPAELLLQRDNLNQEFNATGAPAFTCSALRGEGVLEALHAMITLVMRNLAPARAGAG